MWWAASGRAAAPPPSRWPGSTAGSRGKRMAEAPVPILMYHAIAAEPNEATRELSVTPEAFAEQLAVLGELGSAPVDTARLAARWRSGRPLPARPVLITFDDGY